MIFWEQNISKDLSQPLNDSMVYDKIHFPGAGIQLLLVTM